MISKIFISIFCSLIALPAVAQQTGLGLDVDVSIPRNVFETDEITISITLTNLVPGNYPGDGVESNAAFWNQFIEVKFPAVSENGGIITATTDSFLLELTDSGTLEVNEEESQHRDVTLTYTVTGNNTSFSDVLSSDSLTVKVTFEGNAESAKQEEEDEKSYSRDVDVAKEAPSGFGLNAEHLSLTASFSAATEITYTAADGGEQQKENKGVVAVAISTALDGQTIDAYLFNRDSTDTLSSGQCTFNASLADGGACIDCNEGDDELYYLDFSDLQELAAAESGVVISRVTDTSRSSTTLTNLELGESYAVFLYHLPDGVSRTTCLQGEAIKNVSLLEYNGEADVLETSTPACFIATAAYGTMWHDDLDTLRWYRDNVLSKTATGRTFLHLYYHYSPPAAAFIAERPWLKNLVQTTLWVPVETARLAKSIHSPGWTWYALIAAFSCLVLLPIWVVRKITWLRARSN